MREILTRVAAIIVAIGTTVFFLIVPAYAGNGTVCQQTDPLSGKCTVWLEVPGTTPVADTSDDAGPEDTGPGASCYWDPSKQGVRRPPAGPVPCTSEYGYWSNSYNCYIRVLEPQPPADAPAWQGHEPGEGAVYACFQPQTTLEIRIWAQDPPPGSGAGPTPREVAQVAIESMGLSAIDIGIAPEPGPDSIGLVGMPVWMWAKEPGAHTYGPASASASAGGITITATARVHRITWDMGDGATVVCDSAGTHYEPSFGMRHSPDCGHVYTESSADEPDGKYTVTATSEWVITWAGAGQSGTIRLDGLSRSVEISVGEAQVLVQ